MPFQGLRTENSPGSFLNPHPSVPGSCMQAAAEQFRLLYAPKKLV